MSELFDEFSEVQSEMSGVTTDELDSKIKEMQELREIYDEKKKEASKAHADYEQQKYAVLKLLEASGKSKYYVEGLGTVSVVLTKSAKIPKDFETKKSLIDYFYGLGKEAYYSFVTVNSRTLNSYINEQTETNPDFKIQGIEQTIGSDLRFRKEKK